MTPTEITNELYYLARAGSHVLDLSLTGSYYICNPPVTTTDVDVIILCDDYAAFNTFILKGGAYRSAISEYDENNFLTYRQVKGSIHYNYIVTEDLQFYLRFCAATEYCKHLNITDKKARIQIFRTILGEDDEIADTTPVKKKPSPKWPPGLLEREELKTEVFAEKLF